MGQPAALAALCCAMSIPSGRTSPVLMVGVTAEQQVPLGRTCGASVSAQMALEKAKRALAQAQARYQKPKTKPLLRPSLGHTAYTPGFSRLDKASRPSSAGWSWRPWTG